MKNKNDLLEAHKFRYACKEFDTDKKISDENFNYILESGRLSPSSLGWEPWKFIVVQNLELREKIKEFSWGAQGQLPTASHFVLIMARKSGSFANGSEYMKYISEDVKKFPEDVIKMRSELFENFKSNDFNLTDERKLFDWACKQTYIVLGNMMTTAAYINIDSCPIEGFNRGDIENILNSKGIIDVDDFGVSVMVAFGYRPENVDIRPKTRQKIDAVVQWN